MGTADWIAGFFLAAFLALPFGMVASLLALVTEKPSKYVPNAPLISPVDMRRCLLASLVFLVVFTPLCALLAYKDRQDAESWQTYVRDYKCVAVDSRTSTQSRLNPATKTTQTTTVTEYLWRCEGGDEHWVEE